MSLVVKFSRFALGIATNEKCALCGNATNAFYTIVDKDGVQIATGCNDCIYAKALEIAHAELVQITRQKEDLERKYWKIVDLIEDIARYRESVRVK